MKKGLAWLIAILLVGAALLYWGAKELVDEVIGHKSEATAVAPALEQPVGTLVEVTPARSERLAQQVTAVGSLLAQHAITVRAESSGRIAKIAFEEGRSVQAGALLVQLDTDLLQAELQQAQAQAQLANSRAHRAQQLSQQGFISAQAQDESNSERAVVQAQVNIIKTRVDKSQIKAPFDGVLGLRYVSVGDYVNEGTELVALASLDQLQVDFRIPEQYLTQVQVGANIRLQLDAQGGHEFQGQIKAISPMIDEQGRSVVLRAHVPNPNGELRPGQFARVVLDLAEVDALMVPETALAPSGQAQYIYRVIDGNTAQRIETTVGIRRDGWVQVSGIEAGDLILSAGLQKVQDGSKLRFEAPAKTLSVVMASGA